MSRLYSTDQVLTALANELERVRFDLSVEDIADFHERAALINVFLYPGRRVYRVSLCLGGKVRTLGITTDGPKAARFADMAKLFFWPFRLRGIRPPCDGDFNFNLEVTKQALEENEIAVDVLEKIKDHLLSIDALKIRPEGAKEGTRRTLRGDVTTCFAEQQKEIAALTKTVAHSFDQIKQAFQHILEQHRLAEKQHVELRNALGRIENLFVRSALQQDPRTYGGKPIFNEGDALKQFDHTPCLDSTLTYRRNDDGTLERLDYTPSIDNTPGLGEIEQENNWAKDHHELQQTQDIPRDS